MQITEEMVLSFIADGGASAIQAARGKAAQIAAQMNAEIATNKSHTSTNTIKMEVVVKIDGDARKVEIDGGFGFTVPNLSDKSPKIVRDLPHPDQAELPLQDGKTPEPTEEPEEKEEIEEVEV